MKIIVFVSVLLVFCSASADQTELMTANQQPFLQDIHAVLRELTASLAVQKEQISVLQKENQGAVLCISVSSETSAEMQNDKHSWFVIVF